MKIQEDCTPAELLFLMIVKLNPKLFNQGLNQLILFNQK
jgi:hypothetical protein